MGVIILTLQKRKWDVENWCYQHSAICCCLQWVLDHAKLDSCPEESHVLICLKIKPIFITTPILLTDFQMSVDPDEIIIESCNSFNMEVCSKSWIYYPENFSKRCLHFWTFLSRNASTCICCVGAVANTMGKSGLLNIISKLN